MSTLVAQTISNGTVSTSSANVIRGSARAWVNYNQVTSTINGSYNVSSVTNNGTGDFTINYTSALPNANYSWAGSTGFGVGGQTNWLSLPANIAVASCLTTTFLRVVNSYANATLNSNLPYNGVIVFSS